MKSSHLLKKWTFAVLISLALATISTTFSSCKAGYGCPVSQKYQVKTNKKGELSTKRGKSRLMSKKRKKRSKY